MRRIAVIYGGKSVEHDISVITGLQMIKILEKNYNCFPIYIDGDGKWWTGKNLQKVNIYSDFLHKAKSKKRVLVPFGSKSFLVRRKKIIVDSCIVCCHGINGEDGSISSVLELADIPYSSSGILSSAISMDKALTKIMLDYNKILSPKFDVIFRKDFESNQDCEIDKVIKHIEFPIIVKPANLGSSVGISVCRDRIDLIDSIKVALNFDDKIVIEQYLENSKEFNCACFEYKNNIYISKVNQIDKGMIYSFDEKYLQDKDKKRTKISSDLENNIKELTKITYKTLECFGIVRVDFLVWEDKLYVNEINSIPGSMACYLFSQRFDEILDLIIDESKRRSENKSKIKYSYQSDALKVFEETENLYKSKK